MNLSQLIWLFFGFSGRISRAAYFLAAMLMSLILAFLLYRAMLAQEAGIEGGVWDVAFSLSIFVSLWGQAALGIKRIHDIGRPALFAVALFLPVINVAAFVALCLIPGDSRANAYGRITNAPNGT